MVRPFSFRQASQFILLITTIFYSNGCLAHGSLTWDREIARDLHIETRDTSEPDMLRSISMNSRKKTAEIWNFRRIDSQKASLVLTIASYVNSKWTTTYSKKAELSIEKFDALRSNVFNIIIASSENKKSVNDGINNTFVCAADEHAAIEIVYALPTPISVLRTDNCNADDPVVEALKIIKSQLKVDV
ncbi:hypothetical protein [Novosphingobium sp. ZW T3_23]|uniref:hypothetical protein n=1 Tax=Novosphingobium sp. ZW T3_23 TaxID=3378084 RepID=UPI003852F3CC